MWHAWAHVPDASKVGDFLPQFRRVNESRQLTQLAVGFGVLNHNLFQSPSGDTPRVKSLQSSSTGLYPQSPEHDLSGQTQEFMIGAIGAKTARRTHRVNLADSPCQLENGWPTRLLVPEPTIT